MSTTRAIEEPVEPTLGAAVFRRIRAEIISCDLVPNERLRIDTLRERYGVGGSPIREALMRLEAEGLVELEQNKGFRVSGVSRDELIDVMRMRTEVEAIGLRWSIERGDVEWEANLIGAFHRLSRQNKVDARDDSSINPDWFKEHRVFHEALAAACGSPTLLSIRESLFDRTTRYVAVSVLNRAILRDDIAEHEQILRAALDRDVVRVVRLNTEHIDGTTKKVLKSLAHQARPSNSQTVLGKR